MEDPSAKFVLYPDDPKGCTIINRNDLQDILDKNDLKVKMRSAYNISHFDGRDVIEIENAPFEVAPIGIVQDIQALAEKGELPEISNVDGCSVFPGDKFRISIEVKRGYDPHAIMTKLYKKTHMEETFITKYAFVNGLQSVDYTLRIAILEWIRHRMSTIRRIYKIRQVNILKRMHFLEPLIKVIESGEIDEFVKIVRYSKGSEAVKKIMVKFGLTDYQAEKIVDVKISDLSMDKLADYKAELKSLIEEESGIADIVKSKKRITSIMIDQLREGIEKYGTPRKSKITQLIDSIQIPDTNHFLVFTNRYIKKLPYDDRGWKIGRLDNNEKVLKVITVNNRDTVAIFTGDGRCIPICVNDIGNSSIQSSGILYTQIGAKDNNFADAIDMSAKHGTTIVAITRNGIINKTLYDDISEKNKPFVFMKLDKGDSVCSVITASDKDNLIVYTSDGKAAIFPFDDFETTALNTKGVLATKLNDGEHLVGVSRLDKNDDNICILTDRGYMKRFTVSTLPVTKRNGRCIEINSGNGNLINAFGLNLTKTTRIIICTTAGAYVIDPANVKLKTRIARAERVIELKSTDYAFNVMV